MTVHPVFTLMRGRMPFFLCCALCVSPAAAQSFARVEETKSNSDAYYYYVQPGSPTVQVYVLGMACYPGLYEVNEGISLRQLLALSGGPDFDRRQFLNRQTTTIRLFRTTHGQQSCVYEALLEKAAADPAAAQALQDGDVLAIEVVERRRFDWRDILTIVNVVNTVVLIMLAVDRLSGN
jgi:protein involved in polysaccharide export with SLBB domain